MTDKKYKIRPSARLIKTIGKDLVKDKYAAVVELVKNSYDADASICEIKFIFDENESSLTISISDNGHGMSLDTVVNKWMVPATSDKLNRKESPEGRPLQGRKGIGRFAAAALGDRIYLQTKENSEKEVSLLLDLNDFSSDKLLEDVDLIIDEGDVDSDEGTYLEIVNENYSLLNLEEEWGEKFRSQLILELKKLLAPNDVAKSSKKLGYGKVISKFNVKLEFENFPNDYNEVFDIKPFNIVDLFDYRVYGSIDEKGHLEAKYVNQNTPNLKPEIFKRDILFESKIDHLFPGKVMFDFRVFDRDPESIEQLINRGLKDPINGENVGKRKARDILNEYYGVSIFRGDFRVRPYGDRDYDWLELDKKRVQNPSFKIGHNQVIGFVNIQSEEYSKLEEKSARDGLLENNAFLGLKFSLLSILNELEVRRYSYREKVNKGRKTKTIEETIGDLFDLDTVSTSVSSKIENLEIPASEAQKVIKIIDKELDKKKKSSEKELKKIQETIALYQGQATLGKITQLFLHEGRKHIKAINEIPPRINRWVEKLLKLYDEDLHGKLKDRSQMLVNSSKAFSLLFKRIEPLSSTRRPSRRDINLLQEINSSFMIFESELEKFNIEVEIDVDKKISIYGSSFDLTTIFSNLIENSIYWMKLGKEKTRNINVEAFVNEDFVEIYFSDTGPGFQGANLELMFEPGFSMKSNGTGLGLALVGESILRIGGEVRALKSEVGAEFLLKFKKGL